MEADVFEAKHNLNVASVGDQFCRMAVVKRASCSESISSFGSSSSHGGVAKTTASDDVESFGSESEGTSNISSETFVSTASDPDSDIMSVPSEGSFVSRCSKSDERFVCGLLNVGT